MWLPVMASRVEYERYSGPGRRGGLGLVGRECGGGSMRLIRKDPETVASERVVDTHR